MNTAWGLLSPSGVERLGWALFHSVWEGALIAVVFALARLLLGRYSSNVRYLTACGMLLATAVAPFVTAVYGPIHLGWHSGDHGSARAEAEPGFVGPNGASPHSSALATSASLWLAEFARTLEWCFPWVVSAWICGVALLSCRWLQGLWWLRRVRTVETHPVEARWLAVLEYLKCRFGIQQRVRLVKSALAEVPMVIGWFRPVILLPASTLSGLSPDQLEAIIAHELAHVRRYDYLINAFQNIIETLFFYHPAVWWISRCIREEREHCCDDLVLRVCQDRLTYARALFRLEELRGAPARLAFGAGGAPLLQRIRRLVGGSPEVWPVTVREFSGLSLLAIGCVLAVAGAFLLFGPETFCGTARIRIERERGSLAPVVRTEGASGSYDPYFIQTEFEVLQSQLILGKVVDQLNLTREWGKKYSEVLKKPETIDLLRRQMDLRPLRNTSIIEIRVYDENADEAALLANTIAMAYADYRTRKQQQGTGEGMENLLARMKEQDNLVAEAQAKVDQLRTQLKIPDSASAGNSPSMLMSAETLRRVESLRLESQAEYVRARTLLEKLRELKAEELPQAISTTGIQDINLNQLLEQQNLVEQKLVATQKEFGPQSSEVIKLSAQSEDLKQKIKARTDGILRGLEARVASLHQGLIDLSNEVVQADVDLPSNSYPYFQAKRELEERQRFRQVLLTKIASEKTDSTPARDSGVEVVDQAFAPSRPSSPNRPRAIAFMAGGVLLAGLGLILVRSGRNQAMTMAPG